MQKQSLLIIGLLGLAPVAFAEDSEQIATFDSSANFLTGEDVSLGGVIFPHLHFNAAVGTSTSDDIAGELGVGHHDPNREGFTMQNLEVGASLRLGDYIEGFTTYASVVGLDDDWSGVLEEAFIKLKGLPGGFSGLELRGGRYFNRFGFNNAVHPHGYFFVDKDLLEGRMLGEDGFSTEGAELTWRLPTPFTSAVSYSYGTVFSEGEHDHGHGDEHGEEEEALFEAEGAALSDELHTLHWLTKWDYNDFHQFSGHLSAVWGDNGFGEDTSVYTAGIEHLWRENGYEPGGRYLRSRVAFMMRDINAISGHLEGEEEHHDDHDDHEDEEHHDDEHGEHDDDEHDEDHHDEHDDDHEEDHHDEEGQSGSLSEWGVSGSVHYGLNDCLELGLGLSWVEGIVKAGIDERLRISPLVTVRPTENTNVKLQYNFDRLDGSQEEHSVWLGVGFDWGGQEVR